MYLEENVGKVENIQEESLDSIRPRNHDIGLTIFL